jgi:ABC-type transporter Mla maintaining outer membrane lipid asymmetry permease subunit MlaE
MPNTLEEFARTVGVTVGELIFVVLREGAIGGAVLALIAFLLSRFTREIYGRALLAIFLITAAGAYFVRLCRAGGSGSDMAANRVGGGLYFRRYGLARVA